MKLPLRIPQPEEVSPRKLSARAASKLSPNEPESSFSDNLGNPLPEGAQVAKQRGVDAKTTRTRNALVESGNPLYNLAMKITSQHYNLHVSSQK